MVFDPDLKRHTLQFKFTSGAGEPEIQDCGFWSVSTGIGSDDSATCAELSERVRDAWNANVLPARFSALLTGDRVQTLAYRNGPTQPATGAGESGFTGVDTWTGTGQTALPPQLSIAVSTYTYPPGTFQPLRGRRRRGRMYPPVHGSDFTGSGGELTNANQTAWLDMWLAFFSALTGSGGDPVTVMQPVVVSLADSTQRDMTHLRVGRLVDTQRRRRNRLTENYVDGSLV